MDGVVQALDLGLVLGQVGAVGLALLLGLLLELPDCLL